MFCLDCNHRLTEVMEKAMGEPSDKYRLVHESTLTGSWVCGVTGNEHRDGDVHDYVQHVLKVVPAVLKMVDDGDLTARQGLTALAVDLGFQERDEAGKTIKAFLDADQKGIDPNEALKLPDGYVLMRSEDARNVAVALIVDTADEIEGI